MAVATLAIRVNGFEPNIILVFAVWTMRPRMAATPVWYLICNCLGKNPNPYLWTFKDVAVEETLLNIFSLPFALFFIINRHDSQQGWCALTSDYLRFWDSFYIIAGAGAVSLILLVCMVLHICTRLGRKYSAVQSNSKGTLSRFWEWTLTLAGFNMLVSFAGHWLLWSAFISNAGAAWATALFLIAIGRPFIGGPAGS